MVTIEAASASVKIPRFNGVAYTGAPMKPFGFGGSVIVDLAGVEIKDQHRPVLRQHDHEQIVGHTTAITVHPTTGITVAGLLSGQTEHVAKVTEPAKNGFRWQLSIGAEPASREYIEAGAEAVVNGRKVAGPMTISRKTELGEISFVPLGADQDTSATIAAAAARSPSRFLIMASAESPSAPPPDAFARPIQAAASEIGAAMVARIRDEFTPLRGRLASWGLASRTGVFALAHGLGASGVRAVNVAYAPGWARTAANVELRLGHDGAAILDQRTGLIVDCPMFDTVIRFADTPAARRAIDIIRAQPHRGLSVGISGIDAKKLAKDIYVITGAVLDEISVVDDPGDSGCRLILDPRDIVASPRHPQDYAMPDPRANGFSAAWSKPRPGLFVR
jgi:phage head maturation protease